MSENVIEVENLKRIYRTTKGFLRRTREEIVAVDGISFNVRKGELFGLLGPNGAGKTTTIKMLTTLLTPTSGTARILGYDVTGNIYEIRRRIGLVFGGERGLYNRVSARQNLAYFADLYGVPLSIRDERISKLLDIVGLADRADDRVEDFSRGMKQRLHIARGLVHDPPLLFFDEPTIGLDPQAARDTRKMIRELVTNGKTILLTTHYMYEADDLCDRVAVIAKGKIVALDTPKSLKKVVRDTTVIEVEAFGATDSHVETLRSLNDVMAVRAEMESEKQVLKIQTPKGTELIPQVTKALEGSRILDVKVREPTLEDAYIRLVGG